MSDPRTLREIAEQLMMAVSYESKPVAVSCLLERAMRLRDQAWKEQLIIFGEEYEEAEWHLPTEAEVNARMVELLKGEGQNK